MKVAPTISIIVPTYNRVRFLPETIDSLLGQTYRNFEIIVVDDCSTDNTVQMIEAKYQTHPNFTLIRHSRNRGESAAINSGWEKSVGELVAIVSSDDPQDFTWLEKMLTYIKSDSSAIFYYPNLRIIDEEGIVLRDVETFKWSRKLIYTKMICVASAGTIINKKLLPREFKPRDESITYPSDLIQFLELSKIGSGIKVETAYGIWRQHAASLTFKVDQEKRAREFYLTTRLWLKNNSVLYGTFLDYETAKMNLLIQVWFMLREQYGVVKSFLRLSSNLLFLLQTINPVFLSLLTYKVLQRKPASLLKRLKFMIKRTVN